MVVSVSVKHGGGDAQVDGLDEACTVRARCRVRVPPPARVPPPLRFAAPGA
jgi:hypothetical protein